MTLALAVRLLLAALLAVWCGGLVMSALRLAAWEDDLVATLLQIRADRTFRVRMAERREAIPREWYRSKALALLAAGDKLQDDGRWARFVPGAWRRVDGLRDRLAARIEREFSEIAVDTVRRELDFRASQLTGVRRDPVSGELLVMAGCADPAFPGRASGNGHAARPQELAEWQAIAAHLTEIEELDQAVQALAALGTPDPGDGEPLRRLVRYTLGAELTPQSSRSAALFRQVLRPADPMEQAIREAHLRQAVRCSVRKRMAALDARLFLRHDLLTTEAALSQRLAELLRARGPLAPVAATLEGWRDVASLISRQEAVLAHQDSAWLQGGGASLGPAHDALLARIARIALLGPDVARQVRGQSDAALQRLRQQLAGVLRAGSDGGLLWLDESRRYAMSPQRLALRDQLAALLQEPFMAGAAAGVFPDGAPGPLGWDVQRLEQVLALRQDRKRFMRERLTAFPPPVRPAIARFVDRQLAQQAEAGTLAAMRVGQGIAELSPDPTAWRTQRRQVGKVQALLVEFGARSRAEKLQTLLVGDVVERLALADQVLAESVPASSRLLDFGWWQGEGSPLLLAVGAADGMALRQALAQQAGRIDAVARRIAVVLEEGAQAAPGHPAVLRWQGIVAEMERYRGGRPDSSLLAMERSLLQLGPELQGGTCAERLAGVAPHGRGTDEFARRHRQILEALARRCGELRGAPGRASESAAIPFG